MTIAKWGDDSKNPLTDYLYSLAARGARLCECDPSLPRAGTARTDVSLPRQDVED